MRHDIALLIAVAGSTVTWGIMTAGLPDDYTRRIEFDLSLRRRTLASSLLLHIGVILFFLHRRNDMYIVEAWLGAATLRQYSISVRLAETLMFVTYASAVAVLLTQIPNMVPEAAERERSAVAATRNHRSREDGIGGAHPCVVPGGTQDTPHRSEPEDPVSRSRNWTRSRRESAAARRARERHTRLALSVVDYAGARVVTPRIHRSAPGRYCLIRVGLGAAVAA